MAITVPSMTPVPHLRCLSVLQYFQLKHMRLGTHLSGAFNSELDAIARTSCTTRAKLPNLLWRLLHRRWRLLALLRLLRPPAMPL